MVAYTCWFAPFFFFCLIYLVYNNLQYKETYTESLMTYCETAFALKFIYWFIFIFFVSILFASNMCEQSTINKAIWIQLFFFFIYSTVLLLPTPRFSGTFFFFWPRQAACGILVPRLRLELLQIPAARSLNHWTSGKSLLYKVTNRIMLPPPNSFNERSFGKGFVSCKAPSRCQLYG